VRFTLFPSYQHIRPDSATHSVAGRVVTRESPKVGMNAQIFLFCCCE
jgi:hypothetical protein